uniref:Indole-3-acetic acid-amido synthetase GH3.6 n=1 Tax=Solanum tuberosum TaxID=4113 RepID=M1CC64_SOLTU
MERTLTEVNKKNLEFIEEVTTNVDEVQKRVLDEILTRNANVEYLQRLNLKGHTDRETFKKVVPVITYEDFQSDINRIANGDRSPILCSQPVSEFLTRGNEIMESISTPTPLNEKDKQQLVNLVDVEIDQEYELVVTTYSGLYRYRMGDVLRVAGYKNNAPKFNFIRRENVILSIDSDKTNELELQNAVKNAANDLMPFDAHVIDYISYADTATIPGYYVLFWELSVNASAPIPPSVLEDCCLTIEESLSSVYRQGRTSDKSIGPLEIRLVETCTFDKLMDYCCTSLLGASINQYKTPRCVKFAPHVELLNSRVMSSYFSPVCPKWAPRSKQWNNTD